MEEDRGSENYGKVVIFLNCGFTKLLRAVVNEQIDTSSAHAKPEQRVDDFLYDKRTILFPRGSRTHAQERSFENTLYPGYGLGTDIDKWDLQLLVFVALRTCDQSSLTLMKDFEDLKEIRNALCHTSDGVLSNDEFIVYIAKVRIIFKRTLNTLKNADTISNLNFLFDTLEVGVNQMVYNESLTRLRSWCQYDKSLIEAKLDRLDEGQENIERKIDRLLELWNMDKRGDGKGIADGAIKMPETEVVVAVKNCKPDQERTISNLLVSLLDSKLRNDAVLKTELSEDCFQRVSSAVQEAVSELSLNGHPLSGVQHGCVVLRIQSSSYTKLKGLWYMAMDGTLARCFRPVEMALKLSYPDVKLDAYIPESEWWRGMAELVERLEERCRFDAATSDDAMGITELSIEDTPDSCITSASIQKPNPTDTSGMTRVSLKIAPTSDKHLRHISDVCKNGILDERLKDVANALKEAYKTKHLEIKVVKDNEKQYFKDKTYTWNRLSTWDEVQVGMVAYIKYLKLWHAVLITHKHPHEGIITAIHYAWPSLFSRFVVLEESFLVHVQRGEVWEQKFPSNWRRDPQRAIERARMLIGERKFNMFTRRSSHMILECVLKSSHQAYLNNNSLFW